MHKSLDGNVRPMYKGQMHLSAYMVKNGLSDEEVATGIKCTRPTVSRIRRRKVRPDWQTIEEIKKFTNGACTADDFQDLETAPQNEAAQ
jgi:transcriptional regulator with XRE-family HTH domain